MTQKIVHVLMSRQLRVVVVCQSCPLDPSKFGENKKPVCMHLHRKANRQQRRHMTQGQLDMLPLIKEQQCEWYKNDSIRKGENGINILDCTF